jgi:succinate dehydrogenase/fumarate reductase cytochrome b subunit
MLSLMLYTVLLLVGTHGCNGVRNLPIPALVDWILG